jgi:hypothetical protein
MERRQSEAGRGRPGRGQGQAWPGRQCEEHLAVVATRVEAMREREKHEKERAGPGTIPTYVRRANTSADEHKQVGLRNGCGALCSSATRLTYVTYVGLKIDEHNSKYERQPHEHKKPMNECHFPVVNGCVGRESGWRIHGSLSQAEGCVRSTFSREL